MGFVACGTPATGPGGGCADGGCGGGGVGPMGYVGHGQGGYVLENGYRYVGYGGDFGQKRRDFTCCIVLSSLLCLALIPLLAWLLWPKGIDCDTGFGMCQTMWSPEKQDSCCAVGRCCLIPTQSNPAPVPAPLGPVDPFNCADLQNPAAEWSSEKKQWCCDIHGKGCPPPGGSYGPVPAAAYDCNAGFANWVKGWSIPKKLWCCQQYNTGCIGSGDLNMVTAAGEGYGAGAQHGTEGAPIAQITGIIPADQLNGR